MIGGHGRWRFGKAVAAGLSFRPNRGEVADDRKRSA
jgi:hypothetical protein